MRKFRFSLEAALGMRERSLEVAENAFRAVQEEWNDNQRRQEQLTEEVRLAEEAVRNGPVDPVEFIALDRYRSAARRRKARMMQEAVTIERQLTERRQALQTARRDKELLVRLKEKALVQWKFDYEKEQQQLAEEAYLSRWKSR